MAKNEILIRLRVDDKGNLKVASKDAEKLSKSTDKAARSTEKLNKSRDKYNRTEKGVAGISSNSTKNFSKMQQSIGGEGGSGGLVRAYALLAANVFALTAAFGVLSRASQVEVLITSIERLEVVSGKSITNVGRDLQAASRGALDFASSLRSVSLATSAGFNSDQIARLGEVATNASISLGRNLADGLDRIFRGVIKVEPELLDEIGLFVRVNEAATKYAADLGVAATDLTEFQRRQAFANEALEQGEKKFGVFADIDPAPLDRLSASLIDISQSALGFVTDALNPLLNFLVNNSSVLIGVFGAIVFSLLRQVVPALGTFALNATQAAEQAQSKLGEVAKQITAAQQAQIAGEIKVQQELKKTATAAAEAAKAKRKAADSGLGGQAVAAANQSLNRARSIQGEINALEEKSAALERSRRKTTEVRINKEQAAIKAEIAAKQEILRIEQQIAGLEAGTVAGADPAKGSALDLEQRRARLALFRAQRVEIISNTAATKGLTAGLRELGVQLKLVTVDLANETILTRAATRATIAFRGSLVLLQTAFTKVLGALTPLLLVFSFLPAILEGFKKLIGASTEATDKFNEATEKSSNLLDALGEKLEQTRKTLADTATGAAADADALQAQANALSEQANALIEARRALEAVQAEREGTFLGPLTTDRPQERDEREFLKETLKQRELNASAIASLEAAGFTNLQRVAPIRQQITESLAKQAALLNEAKRLEDDTEVTGAARVKQLKDAENLRKQAANEAKNQLKVEETLNTLLEQIFNPKNTRNDGDERGSVAQAVRLTAKEQTDFATASANIDSALEGAKESAREFRKNFITKTVVDKPLTSLLQITNALQEQSDEEGFLALEEEERKKRFQEIVDKNSAVLDLLDKQTRENLTNAKTDAERLEILEGAKNRFLEQQVILGRNKALLKELNTEIKLFDNVNKNTNGGIATANILRRQGLEIQKETLKVTRDQALQVANITQETLDEAIRKERAGELESFLLDNNLDRNAVMKAITAQRELENKTIEATIAGAQALNEIEKGQLELRLKTISSQEKLNKTIDKTAELRLKAQNIARGRGADLSPGQELQLQIESFNRSREASDEKLKAEKRIAEIQLEVLDAQANIANEVLRKTLIGVQAQLVLIKKRDNAQQKLLEDVTYQLFDGFATEEFTTKTRAVIDELAINAGNAAREILNSLSDTKGIFSLPEDETFKLANDLGAQLTARLGEGANEARKNIRAALVREQDELPVGSDERAAVTEEIKKFDETTNSDGSLKFLERVKIQASAAAAAISQMADGFLQFGADGAVAHAMADFTAVTLGSIEKFADGSIGDKLQATAQMLGGIANILDAQSDRRIANIDAEIDAEKKRDGKSAESVKKIQQLEKKKEQIARKQFEMQKKMQIAQTIISTAAAVMQTMATGGFLAIPLALVVAAMGAAQVALIARQKFEGGSAAETASATPSTLSLGERTNEVNVANQANRGELAYLRGEQGRGSISNFTPAAAGRKGYANGSDGVVVGERGPEIITPSMPVDIIPNDQIQQGTTNVNFTIHAVDAAGLEQTIQSQRGNIIGMIRDAANGFGEPFLEGVDTDTLTGDGGSY